jgi:hypothetical protein
MHTINPTLPLGKQHFAFSHGMMELSNTHTHTHTRASHHAHTQIPTTMPEETLSAMFAPFGNIAELHMLKKNPGAGQY